ncbi:MAG: gliding motility-associated C-terminal domain-containing protein [Bacteroidetes bacterium]|nr:gliding motility-associated C-terminal domain-containing protein [Bacteroidota bacterium]
MNKFYLPVVCALIASTTFSQTARVAEKQKESSAQSSLPFKTPSVVNHGNYHAQILSTGNDRKNLAFIENAGQLNYKEGLEEKNVLFGFDDNTALEVYFTKKGLLYKITKDEQVSEEEWEEFVKEHNLVRAEEEEKVGAPKYLTRTKWVEMKWLGSNPQPAVTGSERTSFYFNYYAPDVDKDKVIGNVHGYKKISYKNIYPNIDIEFTIHPEEGIKYSYILHAGADASQIKMSYSEDVKLNAEKNIIIPTPLGNITDHAPLTYTGMEPSGNSIESQFFLADKNTVGFRLENGMTKVSEETIIDPWTVGPSYPTGGGTYIPEDISVDGSDNVYVYTIKPGNGPTNSKYNVDKYNSAGTLVWTFDLTANASYKAQSQGDVQVDVGGNAYATVGLGATGGTYYNTIKINTTGTALVWGSASGTTSANNMYETWTLSFNCDYTKLYQSGGGIYPPAYNVSVLEPVNSATGAEGALTENDTIGEILSAVFATNGLLYFVSADSNAGSNRTGAASTGAHNRLSCFNTTTNTKLFSVHTGYSYHDGDQKAISGTGAGFGGSIGMNAVAASCNYVYTMDGVKLDRWNLTTGAHFNQVTIPGGTTTALQVNSGIVTDKCGNVYVGSAKNIYVYDALLNSLGSIAVPGTVYDLAWGSNGKLFACGGLSTAESFLALVALPTCNTAASGMTVTPTQPVGCGGTGSATVTATFCAAPYTYTWSPGGQTTSTVTGLAAGTYTVIVKGSAQCPYTYIDTATVTIVPGAGTLSTTQSQLNLNCNGVCIGSATVTPSGGTPPYTYAWSPSGGTSSVATGLCAGTYTCTVNDGGGCASTPTITITQPTALTAAISSTTVSCNGGSNGTATVTAGGGTPAYTYAWTPSGGTSSTATGLSQGNYTVTVTDSKGCTKTATVSISQPTPVTASISSQTNVSCNGGNNGNATASGSGGTPAYTYVWNTAPAQTAATATGLSAGTYTVTTSDANGCTGTQTVLITQPAALTTTASAGANVSCNGGNNGSASISAGGGTPAYTYSWSNGQTTTSATGLSAGNYTVTVTDSKGCTQTATIAITQPTAITVTTSSTNANCGSNNGTTSATASGGNPAYTYSWNNGQTTTTATGLTAGSYTITVTDNSGCTQSAVANVSNASSPTVTLTSSSPVSCNGGNDGTASITATGGTAPYAYLWCNGQTTTNATGLSAGSCTVTVTDNAGCISIITVNLTQPTALTSSLTPTAVSCNGGNNGSATVTAGGGTPSYTYSWTGGQTTSTATGLTQGNYTVTITDANGCTATGTVSISQPTAVTASVTAQTNVLCNGGNNGSASASGSGGNPAYTYSWSNGQTTSTATGLTQGNYTIIVTDASGCTGTQTVLITQPAALTSPVSQTNVSCNGGNNGSATVTAGGGNPAYTYSWTNGQTTSTATGLSQGNYTITVTDANGCTSTNTVAITEPTILSNTTAVTPSGCSSSTGSATATTSGGTPAYTYAWSNGQTTSTATGLSAGTYTVTITDANGCTFVDFANILNGGAPTVNVTPSGVSCNGGNNGNATATVSGGNPPYTYSWTNGQTTSTATGLSSGNYTVTITDASGCSQVATIFISEPSALTTNPSQNNVSCNGGINGDATATVSGGTPNYTYSWTNGQTTSTATGLAQGNYTVSITDANGCTATQTFLITEPAAITNSMTITQANCSASNGDATSTPSGGTGTYTYIWSNGQTTSTATGLAAGFYTVTITDANGCTLTDVANVTNAGAPTVTLASTTVTCNGGTNGSATATATGGNPPYTYAWSNGASTSSATGLSAGTYTITITDASGCIQSNTVSVSQPSAITSTTTTTPAVCTTATGTATDNPSGGTPGYSYLWNNGQTTATATGLAAGNYSVTITDANGCTQTQTVTITSVNTLTLSTSSTQTGCTVNNGTATANASSGTAPYTYSWTNGQTTAAATGLAAGNYTATVTDANGCIKTQTVSVTQIPGPTVTANASPTIISTGASTTLTATSGGGTYSWSPASGLSCTTCANPVATPAQTTAYCVVVTDANGCTDSACVTITIEIPCIIQSLDALLPNAFSPNGDVTNDQYCVPQNACIISFVLKVYDRWGEKVFESDDLSNCWDGMYKGQALNTAVFVYFFEAQLSNGDTFKQKGNISLVK